MRKVGSPPGNWAVVILLVLVFVFAVVLWLVLDGDGIKLRPATNGIPWYKNPRQNTVRINPSCRRRRCCRGSGLAIMVFFLAGQDDAHITRMTDRQKNCGQRTDISIAKTQAVGNHEALVRVLSSDGCCFVAGVSFASIRPEQQSPPRNVVLATGTQNQTAFHRHGGQILRRCDGRPNVRLSYTIQSTRLSSRFVTRKNKTQRKRKQASKLSGVRGSKRNASNNAANASTVAYVFPTHKQHKNGCGENFVFDSARATEIAA